MKLSTTRVAYPMVIGGFVPLLTLLSEFVFPSWERAELLRLQLVIAHVALAVIMFVSFRLLPPSERDRPLM